MDSDTINRTFTKAYNDIVKAYDAADETNQVALRQCIAQARALLAEHAIPRYHSIKTQLLLVSMLPDVDEAAALLRDADIMFRVLCTQHRKGEDAEIDEGLDELSAAIEDLRTKLHAEQAGEAEESEEGSTN